MADEAETKVSPAVAGVVAKPCVYLSLSLAAALLTFIRWVAYSEKVVKVEVVQAHANSSDEENEDGETEDPDVDDSEILQDLPDDTEVCPIVNHRNRQRT